MNPEIYRMLHWMILLILPNINHSDQIKSTDSLMNVENVDGFLLVRVTVQKIVSQQFHSKH